MADYHSLLTRAVANLPSGGTPATREAIYVRARKALIEQLRSLRPPLPESDIAREANALDAAIAQIEARFGVATGGSVLRSLGPRRRRRLRPLAAEPGAAPPPSPKPARADRARSTRSFPAPGYARVAAERADGRVSRSAGEPAATAVPSGVASAGRIRSTVRSAANTAANIAAPSAPAGLGAGRTRRLRLRESRPPPRRRAAAAGSASTRRRRSQTGVIPSGEEQRHVLGDWERKTPERTISSRRPISPRRLGRAWADEVHASAAPPVVATRPDEPVESAAAPEVPGEFDRPGAGARQDFEGQRPVAPGIDDGKPKPWLWIAAAVALGVVLAVAGAAILMRQKPQDLAIKPPVEATAPPAPQPPAKIAERVEATPANPAAPAATASAAESGSIGRSGRARRRAPAAETQSPPAASAAARAVGGPRGDACRFGRQSAEAGGQPGLDGVVVDSCGARPAGDCRGEG